VPSTDEWLARICSIRVDPDRGRPTTKIGASEAPALPFDEEFAREHGLGPGQEIVELFRVVGRLRAPEPRPFCVMSERAFEVGPVLQSLAEGIVQVEAVFAGHLRAPELNLHGRDLVVGKLFGLEVGEAPVGVAEARLQFDRVLVRGHGLAPSAGGAQGVAQAEPDARLVGRAVQDGLEKVDGLAVFTNEAHARGVEIAQAGVHGIGFAQPLDVRQGVGRLLLAVEDDSQVVPRGLKARRQIQAVFEQAFGVGIAAEARAGLGQHPHGRHVRGVGLEALAQQVLGHRQAILDQGQGRDPQSRVSHAGLDVARVGLVGAGCVPKQVELLGDDAPGVRKIRPQGHGVA